MKTHPFRLLVPAALLFGACAALPALEVSASSSKQTDPGLKQLTDASAFRAGLAAAILNGTQTSDGAIAQLKAKESPDGVAIDPDAGVGLAAVDMGHRMLVLEKREDALRFFAQGEKSLTAVLARTPDAAAKTKADYLATLAFIRAQYLNKWAEAKADINAALRLLPGDGYLVSLRNLLASDKAAVFGARADN